MDDVFPGSSAFIPIRDEFTVKKSGGSHVRFDILGITLNAKLVLIECKLWDNPQSRRKVVAQALEYASILASWSYDDLTNQLKQSLSNDSGVSLYKKYRDGGGIYDEKDFHDFVARDLRAGDFIVIIAGDGIREDVASIAKHVNHYSNMATKLALVEFRIFKSDSGDIFISPQVFMRTKIIEHRVYLGQDNQPLVISQADDRDATTQDFIDPEQSKKTQADRAFWQDVIDCTEFDHSDQMKPWHVNNWIKIPMPKPVGHISAYRTMKGRAGIFWTLKGDEGLAVYSGITASKSEFEKEVNCTIDETNQKSDPFQITLEIKYGEDPSENKKYKTWLLVHVNKAVSYIRDAILKST